MTDASVTPAACVDNSGAHGVATALREQRARLDAFVRARVPADDAEDVLQAAAVRAMERADQLQNPERVVAWLFRIHRSVIGDWGRRRARQQRWFQDQVQPAEAEPSTPVASEFCRCSLAQVRHLSASYGAVLLLVDLEEMTLPEAAARLGLSVNNATVRLHRARRALRQRMKDHCGVTTVDECADCRCVHEGCCPV